MLAVAFPQGTNKRVALEKASCIHCVIISRYGPPASAAPSPFKRTIKG
jgi:hypothetical protein